MDNKLVHCFQEKAENGKVTQLFQFAESTNSTNSSTEEPPSEEAAGGKTTNSQADFVQFVGLSDHDAVGVDASKPNPLVEMPTATSSFLSTPLLVSRNPFKAEGMSPEEQEHWAYYHSYVEREMGPKPTWS
jgi:hypothetical protein